MNFSKEIQALHKAHLIKLKILKQKEKEEKFNREKIKDKKLKVIKKSEGLKDENAIFAIDKKQTPYNKEGKTNFNIRNKAGVYIIHKGGKIVYIGFSHKDVYKALYRHFQQHNDKTQQRIVFVDLKGVEVSVVYCKSGLKARKLEGALILKHKPPLNINKYDQYVLDFEDKKLLKKFGSTKEGIYIYKGDLPF